MNEDKPTRWEWELAKAEVYKVGHFSLAIAQFAGGFGIAACSLALLMQFKNPEWSQITIGFGCTALSALIWRWATKRLDAVGKHGSDYFYSPFKGPEDPMF